MCRNREGGRDGGFANWGDGVARNFGTLGSLASSGPSAALFLKGWPNEALGDDLSRCPKPGVAEGVKGVEKLEMEAKRDVWARCARKGIAVQLD